MLDDTSYGDAIMLEMMSHLFGIRITILNSVNLRESRFRHNMDLEDADLVIIYNGVDHYSAAGKKNKQPVRSPHYSTFTTKNGTLLIYFGTFLYFQYGRRKRVDT